MTLGDFQVQFAPVLIVSVVSLKVRPPLGKHELIGH